MSISATLSNALSGLTAASRGAEIVSSNVANAHTEGYGRRELTLVSRSLGGTGAGVSVAGVTRVVDQALLNDRRISQAGSTGADATAAFLARVESAIGTPDTAGSITDRVSKLESALIAATSQPASDARLADVLSSATGLADKINSVTKDIQAARSDADRAIATDVAKVNTTLAKVAEMNGQIRTQVGSGRDASALMDQRQQLIDQIAGIIPMQEVPRDNGQIALYTTGGAILLDGSAAKLEFSPSNLVTADMSVDAVTLSGLTINGVAVSTLGKTGPISGGTLAANFSIRDDLSVTAQSQVDSLAQDLIERFSASSVDPTLSPGAPGLFTDAGVAMTGDPGLGGRLTVNPAADPAQGGALWRLRSGLGATDPGPTGDSSVLIAMSDALSLNRQPASNAITSSSQSFTGLAGSFISSVGGARQTAENDKTYAAARTDALKSMELASGVDTDQEMQNLLMVEHAYSANAKVIQVVDDLMKTLLGL